MWELNKQVGEQTARNEQLKRRNAKLEGEVLDLQDGTGAVEERARYELGMVKDGEVFIQFVAPAPQGQRHAAAAAASGDEAGLRRALSGRPRNDRASGCRRLGAHTSRFTAPPLHRRPLQHGRLHHGAIHTDRFTAVRLNAARFTTTSTDNRPSPNSRATRC
ncbi:hypothetical protein OJJOAM_000619 [Cupriavidus sp. H18C1]